jgi:copper chaperone CopZ
LKVKTVEIKGLSDQKDIQAVTDALYDVWGVNLVDMDIQAGQVRVSYDELAGSEIDIEQAVIDQGYEIGRGD